MNSIPFIEEIQNNFNKIFDMTSEILTLEHNVFNFSKNLTKMMFISALEGIDQNFLKSKYRIDNYYSKEIIHRTLITCFGEIEINYRVYVNKNTGERFSLIKELLNIKPYQRVTDEAEYEIVKYAMHSNMTQAGKYAIPDTTLSRSWVSKLLRKLNGSIHREISRSIITPKTVYIEMDEIHANLQVGGNRICPSAIVHEGHVDNSAKRKSLKNLVYFATAKESYKDLWNEIYNYVDKRYDMDKIEYIFISGDGAAGIKNFDEAFPSGIYVLDKFHCKKNLKKIFKDSATVNLALKYLRNNDEDNFNALVEIELSKENANVDSIIDAKKYLLNNIQGIINQTHNEYKCPCSMESHINHGFARYITSSPYGFSLDGLDNKLKLLVYNANKIDLTFIDYCNLKYGENEIEEINNKIYNLQNLKFKYSNLLKNNNQPINYDNVTPIPTFDNNKTKDFINRLLSHKKI